MRVFVVIALVSFLAGAGAAGAFILLEAAGRPELAR
jgi:hypothetical protein